MDFETGDPRIKMETPSPVLLALPGWRLLLCAGLVLGGGCHSPPTSPPPAEKKRPDADEAKANRAPAGEDAEEAPVGARWILDRVYGDCSVAIVEEPEGKLVQHWADALTVATSVEHHLQASDAGIPDASVWGTVIPTGDAPGDGATGVAVVSRVGGGYTVYTGVAPVTAISGCPSRLEFSTTEEDEFTVGTFVSFSPRVVGFDRADEPCEPGVSIDCQAACLDGVWRSVSFIRRDSDSRVLQVTVTRQAPPSTSDNYPNLNLTSQGRVLSSLPGCKEPVVVDW
jgi:hypothetical protein